MGGEAPRLKSRGATGSMFPEICRGFHLYNSWWFYLPHIAVFHRLCGCSTSTRFQTTRSRVDDACSERVYSKTALIWTLVRMSQKRLTNGLGKGTNENVTN